MAAADDELHGLAQSLLDRRIGKQSERILGDGAIMARALDRVVKRTVLDHERDCRFDIALRSVALLERAAPEVTLVLRSAAERQHHRQRDLAVAKIVADVLAELGGIAAVIERIVDQLERGS